MVPPTEAGLFLSRELDTAVSARIAPDTLWDGSVPGYTAAQAVQTLAALREHTAPLAPLDPAAVGPAAHAAGVAAGALRATLVLSGRTTYDAMRDDRSYVAYDMTRRLHLLAEAVAEPRTWTGAGSRALWIGEVADWAGFGVDADDSGGLAALAPMIAKLRGTAPLPGRDPAAAALRLLEPVLVAVVQRALRWAVVAAVLFWRPGEEPAVIDAALPCATGPGIAPVGLYLDRLRARQPPLMLQYDRLRKVEDALFDEIAPSKRAGGHMDVRPDQATVDGLRWQAAAAAGGILLLGRPLLSGRRGPLAELAAEAYAVLESVSAQGTLWPDESVRALRRLAEMALTLTAASVPDAWPNPTT